MNDTCDYLVEEYIKCTRNIQTTNNIEEHINTCFFIWNNLIKCKNKEHNTKLESKEFKYCKLSNYYSFSSTRE